MGNDLNGKPGQSMFSTSGMTAELSPSANEGLALQLEVVDPLKLPIEPLSAQFDKTEGAWILSGGGLVSSIKGKTSSRGQDLLLPFQVSQKMVTTLSLSVPYLQHPASDFF